MYLAAAGIGRLGIVDKDTVELSNLHRQIVHNEAGQGAHKAESAAAACRALNSSIQVCHLWGLRSCLTAFVLHACGQEAMNKGIARVAFIHAP